MKTGTRQRSGAKRFKTNPRLNTYTLSVAKTYLGRLVDKARSGEPVYILRGHERFILQAVPEIEPIPMRPLGHFQFDAEDRKLDKRFAKASVVPRLRSE
jgi:hypothetical protein